MRAESRRSTCRPAPSWLVLVPLLASCAGDAPDAGPAVAVDAVATAATSDPGAGRDDAGDWFVERAAATGLEFVHFNGMSGEFYFPEMIPAGVAWLDYDNDGDLDAYLVQGEMLGPDKTLDDALFPPVEPLPLRGRLFRNDLTVGPDGGRTLRFADVTAESGIDARGVGMGVAVGDVDNDGWVDLYLTNLGRNRLYRNDGDGTFSDISTSSGTDDPGWGVSASFLDYDRDGRLDLYVGNYVQYDFNTDQVCARLTSQRSYCGPQSYTPQTDRLYRNLGQGRFDDVTATALVAASFGPALGVATADFDGDGWIDIYVANDQAENLLWTNQRNGTFVNLGLLSGAALSADGRPEASMGVDAADFDNDGDEDLLMTHLPTEGHNVYTNTGAAMFEDVSASSRFHGATLGYSGWGAAWIDYDNDGWLDILAVNGAIDALPGRPGEAFPYGERNLLLRNTGDRRFEDVTDRAGAVFELVEVSRGAAFGDVDNDGDLDVLVGNLNGSARLLVNAVGQRAHWLGVRLVGADAPRDMLGARVEVVRPGAPTLWRRARSDGSYASANDPRVLVGLGMSTVPPLVRVHWPDGSVERWPDLEIDRWITVTQGSGAAP